MMNKRQQLKMIKNQIKFLQLVDRLYQIILILMLEKLFLNNLELKKKMLVDKKILLQIT